MSGATSATEENMIAAPYPAPATTRHIIDLTPEPIGFQGWQIVEHQKSAGGNAIIVWDSARVELYVDDARTNHAIYCSTVRERLKGKPVLNTNVLDYLLRNPQLIPKHWKKDERGNPRPIFFWGTIYCRPNDDFYVRCLCWGDDQWGWDVYWLGTRWQDNFVAALWHVE
jgi:hypothetical protein